MQCEIKQLNVCRSYCTTSI